MITRQHGNHSIGCQRSEFHLRVVARRTGNAEIRNILADHLDDTLGQRIAKYKIEALIGEPGEWKAVAEGTTIGYRKLDRFPKVTASKVRLSIEKSLAAPLIRSFGVHLDEVSPPESFEPANAQIDAKKK